MAKRKLKRQLGLPQVIMLGTAGTLAAEIFVLTGHAAGMAGPAAVLALLIGGLLSYSVALNYSELATTYPVAGGAMSYVREGFGNNILAFLVGNIQIVLGGALLIAFAVFIGAGLTRSTGFRWDVFYSGQAVFTGQGFWGTFSRILATISLVYNAYVGFEVIADDAEEVKNPSRTIPVGILVSLTLCTLIYVLVGFVTLGTVPWADLVGSETALTDAAGRFLPGFGVPMMAAAGMIATLTSINTAMLSATRETFSLSRDGSWPRALSKLSRFRTPHLAILAVGGISILVATIGLVDLLSYISSVGYLFVLFWGSLAMLRLHKQHPTIERPFKAPFFPLTAYVAGGSCLLIIAFADVRALLFGGAVIAVFSMAYLTVPRIARLLTARVQAAIPDSDLILVAAAKPRTARSLVHLASIIAEASQDTYLCLLKVDSIASQFGALGARRVSRRLGLQDRSFLDYVADEARKRNVALYAKSRSAPSVARGLLDEIKERNHNVKMVLIGWPGSVSGPGSLTGLALSENPVKVLLKKAHTNVVALLDRGLRNVNRILVPVGGGPHSRLALRLAYEIASAEQARVTALRVVTEAVDAEEVEDQGLLLEETIEEVLGHIPENFDLQVIEAVSLPDGILVESTRQAYDLVVIGASEEWAWTSRLFGSVVDWIGGVVPCSVLFCRRYEPVMISWLRRQVKVIEHEYERG